MALTMRWNEKSLIRRPLPAKVELPWYEPKSELLSIFDNLHTHSIQNAIKTMLNFQKNLMTECLLLDCLFVVVLKRFILASYIYVSYIGVSFVPCQLHLCYRSSLRLYQACHDQLLGTYLQSLIKLNTSKCPFYEPKVIFY